MISVSDFELGIVMDIIKKHASGCDVLTFGSRYKWTPKDYSDLDLAFVQVNGDKLGFKRVGDIKEAFEEVMQRVKLGDIDVQIIDGDRGKNYPSEKFSERMVQCMKAYINGLISNEVIAELMKMANEMAHASAEGKEMGLTDEELAFYDAITKPTAVKDFYQNNELVAL